jgi:hypothetical protein
LIDLDEFFIGLFAVWIVFWVVFHGEVSEGFFYLLEIGTSWEL